MSMANERELQGKVALVTGAARNIGRAIALALADAGAAVVVNARTSKGEAEALAAEIERGGGRAIAHLADVTDERAVNAMAQAALGRFGRIDILVNNAAVRDVAPIDSIGYEEWRRVTATILDGAFLCVKACLPALRAAAGAGAIVSIGGMSGHTGAAGRPHVVAAKLGLVGLTRALAHDLAKDGITVNCVVPGLIETKRGASSGRSAHLHETLLGHYGKPADIAEVVRFLAGPRGRYVTGQEWHVNGGAYLG